MLVEAELVVLVVELVVVVGVVVEVVTVVVVLVALNSSGECEYSGDPVMLAPLPVVSIALTRKFPIR